MELVSERLDGAIGMLRVEGRLNMTASGRFRSAVDDLIGGGHHKVVVDLTAATFIDSSGLGALVGALKAARQTGGDLRVAGTADQVRSVLRLTNLDRVLRPFDTVEAALSDW